MRYPLILTILILFFASPVLAAKETSYAEMPAGVYKVDPSHASLVWKVSHMGLSYYTARFTDFDIDLTLDPADPKNSFVRAEIDPTSVRTDHPGKKDFDGEIGTGIDWLNGGEFPSIEFTSTNIEVTGVNTGVMNGKLSFLGVVKPVTLDVTFNGAKLEHPFAKKPVVGFSAHGSLKRSDWGLMTHIPSIGDEVSFTIEAELIKAE